MFFITPLHSRGLSVTKNLGSTSVTDTTDSKVSNPGTLPTRTNLVHALLIDSVARRIVDVYMTPSYQEVEKLIGSSFWVPLSLNSLCGDRLFCDEGTFPVGYADFIVDGRGVTGSGLVVGVSSDHILVDCHMELDALAELVIWNGKNR